MIALYVYKKSIVHKMPFFLKCVLVSCIVFLIYFFDTIFVLMSAFVFSVGFYVLAKLSLIDWFKSIKLFFPFLCVAAVYHIFVKDYYNAYLVPTRIIIAVSITNVVSLSTSFDKILKESEKIFFFLSWFHVSPKLPGLVINIVLRSIPLLYLEKQEIDLAIILRGGKNTRLKGKQKNKMKHRKIKKVKYVRVFYIFSLLLRAVTHTDDLAVALYLRGF